MWNMPLTAAYILTIDTIAERVESARTLQSDLQHYPGLANAEIVPAIYWSDTDAIAQFLASNPAIHFSQKYLSVCKQGQLCATLSHISLWQKLLASDHDGALVFEDDIYISDPESFRQLLDELPAWPELDFLRIHQYKKFRHAIATCGDDQLFVQDPSDWGFATYYISRPGAEKLLQRFRMIDDHVDMIVPVMGRNGDLNIKVVKPLVVEHQEFDGQAADLSIRHAEERSADKLQKAASTIWTSPILFENKPLHNQISGISALHVPQLLENGHTTLKGVFSQKDVSACRQQILQNLHLLRNTRPSQSSLHLAGFQRFPELEAIHTQLAASPAVLRLLEHLREGAGVQSLGLSDITINRSQCWHKDLLRGKFSSYLESQEMCWGDDSGGVYKILFYLQAGSSLKVIRGSHLVSVSLESDHSSEPNENDLVENIPVEEGDIVVMDIRMSHRGADEAVYASGKYDDDPRMLISTALGFTDRPLTRAMEKGNFHRLMDWMERNP
jgi:GR25 family glycosyltransferase involved in LPS biosynthesis